MLDPIDLTDSLVSVGRVGEYQEPIKRQKHLLRVVYKSGYTHDFWVYEFNFSSDSTHCTPCDPNNAPIILGIADVAGVWHIGSEMEELRFEEQR